MATASLFTAVLALRMATSGDASSAALVLFVVPIALCAVKFGTRGGLAAALVTLGLLLIADVVHQEVLGPLGIATRTIAYLLVGALIGYIADDRRSLNTTLARHFELSRDLFCTATFDGYFDQLNPAWERALGYRRSTLSSRPFVEFVHPDDRESTEQEAAKLAAEHHETISFRNRYRDARGEYRWLEWNAISIPEESRIYASARDITAQRELEEALQNQSDMLERRVYERTRDLEEARREILQRLATAVEYRDDDTMQHTERVGRTAALLARQLQLGEEMTALIREAAPLHDIGKVGIPDPILLKPGRLTADEFAVMQAHTEIGAAILANGKFPVLRMARDIALTHHERWDGSGYPSRLQGESIPLAGRITAVADVFDALTHERSYKRSWPLEEAVREIERLAGARFDPRVARAFMQLDHRRLLDPIDRYDLNLSQPSLTGPLEPDGLVDPAERFAGLSG